MPLNGSSLVHQGGGDPDALAHALGIRLHPAVLGRCHLDQLHGPAGRTLRVAQAVQPRAGEHELPAGQEAVHRLALTDQAQS
jgi:hypothetical protein